MKLRVATFNIENLLSRHRFGPGDRPDAAAALSLFDFQAPQVREAVERALAVALEDDKRQMTGLAIAETKADILCLQEVDNLGVLQAFIANYVQRISDVRYDHFRLIEGNDQRGIDVAFACRRDLVAGPHAVSIRSHREETYRSLGLHDSALTALGIRPDAPIFKRDCLEVSLDIAGKALTLFICHFKSMGNGHDNGRDATAPVRRAEARAVREIILRRFGPQWREANWIIAGDLNDYFETIGPGGTIRPTQPSGLDVLVDDFAVNPVAGLAPHERWTHFHRRWSQTRGELIEEHVQLDYLLLSPALAAASGPQPRVDIVRRGQPYRVPLDPRDPDRSIAYLATRADRYPRVGWDRPKASDHCPLVVEITLP